MTSDLTIALPYPQDRFDGFVLLGDGDGHPYVLDLAKNRRNPNSWCCAVLKFMRRMNTPNPFDSASEYSHERSDERETAPTGSNVDSSDEK